MDKNIKVGIISDTHGLLREEVKDILKECDYIVHGGDINKQIVIDELEKIAPLYVVRGNNDKEWAEHLPNDLTFELEGVRFYMVHDKKFVLKDLHDVDIIVFGHSHKYYEETKEGILWLNPGSCGKRRFDQSISMAVMTIKSGVWEIDKIELNPEMK
ncbi:MAG: metallophosphoesterase family protein [Aminipila sp.]